MLLHEHLLPVARTAPIPRAAPYAGEVCRFLDHLLSPRGQRLLARKVYLIQARADLPAEQVYRGLLSAAANPCRMPLGLGLLVIWTRPNAGISSVIGLSAGYRLPLKSHYGSLRRHL